MLFEMLYDIASPIGASDIIAAAQKHERLEVRIKAKELLDKFGAFELLPGYGPHRDSASYLDACKVSLRGTEYSATQGPVKGYIEMLKLFAAVVDGDAGARDFRPGTKSRYHDHVAQKFVDDHLVSDKRDAEVHATKRLSESANVPASTGILKAHVITLDREVGDLNKAGIFLAVEEYLRAVGSYGVGTADEVIDSVCFVSSFKVNGWIFTRAGPGKLQTEPVTGYLAYCVVADDAKPEHRLAYHYQDVVAATGALPHARAAKAWKPALYADFKRKCPYSKLKVNEKDWPVVYYTINAG